MNIFNKKRDNVKAFGKLSKGKCKNSKRKLEEQMLAPEPIEAYAGEMPENFGIDFLTAAIVFPDKNIKKMFEEFVTISYSKVKKANYITDISLFIALIKAMNKGSIYYSDGKFVLAIEKRSNKRKL